MSPTLPSLPEEVLDAVFRVVHGDPDRCIEGITELCGRFPGHAAAIRAHADHCAALSSDPEQIGPYQVQRVLGEGGMGIVYLARQEMPVDRLVALKVMKPGLDTQLLLRRFERERQALAQMSHDCIARLHDAGTTATGRAYFAMELVDGLPLTEYCRSRQLDLRSRLALLEKACAGVQHAHQKGLIHRDLKPSNILVAERDGEAMPKIIDFGLARAAATDGGEGPSTNSDTLIGGDSLLGTPEYMSPEQAEMRHREVDTRTDIYSLGVILYELLTDTLPIESRRLRQQGIEAVRRAVRDIEPVTPSKRAAAGSRFGSALRGDLDWITMRCLEKDPQRRYASASELAADLRRYLADEPVTAGPPTTLYRLRKLVRRRKGLVAAAAAVLVALAMRMVATWRERNRALAAEATANSELAQMKAVREFWEQDIELQWDAGREIELAEWCDSYATRLDGGGLAAAPELEAKIRHTLGRRYAQAALFGQAEHQLSTAVDILDRLGARNTVQLAAALNDLGGVLGRVGRWREAQSRHERVLRLLDGISPRDAEEANRVNWQRLDTERLVAHALLGAGDRSQAMERILKLLDAARDAGASRLLSLCLRDACDTALKDPQADPSTIEQCLAWMQESVELQQRGKWIEPSVHEAYARAWERTGDLETSRNQLRLAFDAYRTKGHQRTLDYAITINNLAASYRLDNRLDDAEPLYRESLALRLALLPADDVNVCVVRISLGTLLLKKEHWSEAAEQLGAAAAGLADTDHDHRAIAHALWGRALRHDGRFAEAEAALLAAYDRIDTAPHGHRGTILTNLFELYEAWHRPTDVNKSAQRDRWQAELEQWRRNGNANSTNSGR